MNKATLAEILKKHGVEIAEDQAVNFVKGIFNAVPEIVGATENKVDDLLAPLLLTLSPKIFELLDKIDGHEG